MKNSALFCLLTMIVSAQAQASCRSAALWAAETAYGNDPIRTEVRQLTASSYEVVVGIGNVEDGAHTYRVTFDGPACDPRTASVCDQTQPGAEAPGVCRR